MTAAAPTTPAAALLLRRQQVEEITQLGRAEIERRIKAGEFPAPVIRSRKCTRWKRSAIEAWVVGLVEQDLTDA